MIKKIIILLGLIFVNVSFSIVTYANNVIEQVNDSYFLSGSQYAINKINLPYAWNICEGSNEVLIGILEEGINAEHEDLKERINVELSANFSRYTDRNPLIDYS